jgi:hypothetical protein
LQQIRINFEYLRPLISKARSAEKWKIDFGFQPISGDTENYEENKMINESFEYRNSLQSSFIVALAKHQ